LINALENLTTFYVSWTATVRDRVKTSVLDNYDFTGVSNSNCCAL